MIFFVVILLIKVSSFQICWNYFFLTTGSNYIRSGRRPMKKKLFQKKNFLGQILKLLLIFFIRLYKENYQKIFFGFLPSFDQNILKMIFGHMSCAKPYSFGQDCPNLFGLGLKWSQWHKLQTNRELFLNLRLDFLFFEKIQFFWKIIKKNI